MPKNILSLCIVLAILVPKKVSINLQVGIYSQTKECRSRSSVVYHPHPHPPPWLLPLQEMKISTDIQRTEKLSSTEELRSCMLIGIFKGETFKMLSSKWSNTLSHSCHCIHCKVYCHRQGKRQ